MPQHRCRRDATAELSVKLLKHSPTDQVANSPIADSSTLRLVLIGADLICRATLRVATGAFSAADR